MRFQPFPVFPGTQLTVQGTPKAIVRDPMTGSMWAIVQTPGPPTMITVHPAGAELPDGETFCGAALTDGSLFVGSARALS